MTASPMSVGVVFTDDDGLPAVNVTFKPALGASVGTRLTICELDDLIEQLRAAQTAFDNDAA